MLAEVETREFGTVAVFNVHLKSKTNRDWRLLAAELVRSAECRLIAAILSGYIRQHPERGVYLLGDFNDTRHSDALRPLFAVPLTDPVGDVVMRNGGNPSTYWPRRRMRIDFILASDRGERLLLADTGFIHRSQQAKRASDHFPVSVDLNPASTDLREMVESGITPNTTRPGFPDHSTAGRQDRADSSGSYDCPHLV
ncbi:MAG: endonuclease/exonuclease/phosphatase family protein [Pseudomonadales bacterium]